jgi:hypothetical protein
MKEKHDDLVEGLDDVFPNLHEMQRSQQKLCGQRLMLKAVSEDVSLGPGRTDRTQDLFWK